VNGPTNEPPSASPGYAMPDRSYRAPRVHHTSHVRLFVIFAVSLAVLIAVAIGVRALVVKPVRQPVCPQDCQGPPKGPPGGVLPSVRPAPPAPTGVLKAPAADQGSAASAQSTPDAIPGSAATTDGPRPQTATRAGLPMTQAVAPFEFFKQFHAKDSDGGFWFAYPDKASRYATSVTWNDGDNTVMLFGGPTDSDPQEIAQRFVKKVSPNATLSYRIPNARVGYQSGYGEIDDFVPLNSSGSYDPQRVVVMVAVKNGVALVAAAAGPTYWPAQPSGHPTGAKLLEIDEGVFYYWVNSFRWKDDPPR
jgi:hypothetical protein